MLYKNFRKVLALSLVLAALLTLGACARKDPFTKMSPKEQLIYLDTKGIKEMNTTSTAPTLSTSISADMDVRVGDGLLNLIKNNIGSTAPDLSFLKKISLGMDMDISNTMYQYALELGLNDQKIADAVLQMDMAGSIYWLGLPGLVDTYAKIDMEKLLGQTGGNIATPAIPNTTNISIDPAVIRELLLDYVTTALNGLNNVKSSQTTLELDGKKQKVTMLTTTISEENITSIALTVLKKAQTDTRIKTVLEELGKTLKDSGTPIQDLYKAFTDAVEDAIDELENTKDFKDDNYIVSKIYVNSERQVIGRQFSITDEGKNAGEISYMTVTQKDAFAVEAILHLPENASFKKIGFSGSGTIKNDAKSGTFHLVGDFGHGEKTLLEAVLTSDSTAKGKLVLEPTADLLNLITNGAGGYFDLSVELLWDTAKSSTTINLLMNDALFVGLDITAKTKDAATITPPANVTDCSNPMILQQWAQGINLQVVLERLSAAGLPALPPLS